MSLTIETTPNILGRTDESPVGKKLFAVAWIDSDDCEDTKIELWIANDDDDLYDLIVAESVSAYERDGIVDEGEVDSAVLDIYRKSIEDSWGSEILYAEIGTII